MTMTQEEALKFLQTDLANEISHQMFYLYAASMVEGLHREELQEIFMKEAGEEMGHVHEFANLIVYLGGKPQFQYSNHLPDTHDPYKLLAWAVDLENHVATNYALRLQQTEAPPYEPESFVGKVYDPMNATLHVFYEDQIKNSQMAAWEMQRWLTRFPIKVTTEQ